MGKILVIAEKPSVGRDIAKVLGCRSRGNGCLFGDDYIITWAVGHLVALASPEELERYLELRPGSVTPLGALCDGEGLVRLYLDRDFWKEPRKIGVHPCDNTATVWLDPDDLVRLLTESGHEPCLIDL